MKANEVLKLLQISRSTLFRWREDGILKATKLPTGHYDWDEECVYALLNENVPRGNYIYTRVSTIKQKPDLANQVDSLKAFAFKEGLKINGSFQDVASGISFKKRKQFFELLDLVIDGKVENVIITYKDRLSRVGFELFEHLFARYHTNIIVMSELEDEKTDSQEIFEEIISLLHSFSMRMYSGRRRKIKEALKDDSGRLDETAHEQKL